MSGMDVMRVFWMFTRLYSCTFLCTICSRRRRLTDRNLLIRIISFSCELRFNYAILQHVQWKTFSVSGIRSSLESVCEQIVSRTMQTSIQGNANHMAAVRNFTEGDDTGNWLDRDVPKLQGLDSGIGLYAGLHCPSYLPWALGRTVL